jgi:hypothetical protein
MRVLLLAMCLLLALGLGACRDKGAAAPQDRSGPSLFVGVYDMPCPQVQKQAQGRPRPGPGRTEAGQGLGVL